MLTFLRFIYFFDESSVVYISSNKSIPSIETYYCQITQVDARPHGASTPRSSLAFQRSIFSRYVLACGLINCGERKSLFGENIATAFYLEVPNSTNAALLFSLLS